MRTRTLRVAFTASVAVLSPFARTFADSSYPSIPEMIEERDAARTSFITATIVLILMLVIIVVRLRASRRTRRTERHAQFAQEQQEKLALRDRDVD